MIGGLGIPPGPGAGRARYGAAMALWAEGRITADQLEAYRIAAATDEGGPGPVLAERGLSAPDLAPPGAQALIAALVEEADRYLATLSGPGVAEVRAGIAAHRGGAFRPPAPQDHPVVQRHLPAALAAAAPRAPALAALIAAAAPHLAWTAYDRYPADQIGADFLSGNAYALLVGPHAPIQAPDFDLGLFLIAPHALYRDHHHPAPELYAPLTGPHGWRFGPDRPLVVKPAHHPVWNPPNQPHLTKVGPVPFLCVYGWTRDTQAPARVIPASDWPALETLRL